ncbi:MAG: hypothetical protein R3F23_08065 [Verrucomicrobiia bacterium]
MDFDQAQCHFDYRNDRFQVDGLDLRVRNKMHLKGWAAYDWKTSEGEFSLRFADMPLARWVTMTLKPRLKAELRGKLWWKGHLREVEDSQASGHVILDGAELLTPQRLKNMLNTYSLRCPDYFFFKKARANFVYWNQNFQATSFEFDTPNYFKVLGKLDYFVTQQLNLTSEFHLNSITTFLPKKLKTHLSGNAQGTVNWSGLKDDWEKGSGKGTLRVSQGKVIHLTLLKSLSRFLKDPTFLYLTFNRASLQWEKSTEGEMHFSKIDLFAQDKCGLKGYFTLGSNKTLSGKLKIGLPPKSLRWLPEAETAVFKEKQDGLCWATVKLSGTLKKPQEDLSSQIKKVLFRHPLALLRLAFRGISWWLGNLLEFDTE